ncbi:MAG: hypothetical protein Q8835_03440 [Sweet potato little leaf phytoplasma]|nr:hypothetical protein [Sweet potato little leaf phytoplasma]
MDIAFISVKFQLVSNRINFGGCTWADQILVGEHGIKFGGYAWEDLFQSN